MLTLKYGRDAERESDIYGVEYSAKAGYEVGESAAFFNSLGRISGKSGQRLPTWQSSHPDPGERESRINQLALEMRQKYGDLKVGEAEYLRRIDGLVVGENPRQGVALRGKFYHPDLDFQFDVPEGWRVKNEAGRVTLVDSQGKGVVIFSGGQGDTPEEAARSFVASSKVQPIRSEPSRLGGSPGYVVESVVSTSNGSVLMRNEFFSHSRSVFSFLSYALIGEIEFYRPAFDQISGSFSPIQDAAIRNLQPARLNMVSADREAEFGSYLSADLPYGLDNMDLAIINQMDLKDKVRKGQKLKLVSQ
jgi:predicted Zn-dependent protease